MVTPIVDGHVAKIEQQFDETQFDWVQLRKDFNVLEGETRRDRFLRKINENPVVPVGKWLMTPGQRPCCTANSNNPQATSVS